MNKFLKLFLALALIFALCLNAIGCDIISGTDQTPDSGDTSGDNSQNEDSTQGGSGDGTQGGTGDGTQDGTGDGTQNGTGDGTQNGSGDGTQNGSGDGTQGGTVTEDKVTYSDIQVSAYGGFTVPAYSGNPYYVINNNVPFFTQEEIVTESYEKYGALDSLGRVTTAIGCLGVELMPTGQRGDISAIKPTGWIQASYSVINGGYLYNRCHMIGWQLTAEDANRQNLMTGTASFNKTMIPFENQIADYLKEETENHVMYRITPIFNGNNLLADGIILEAYSVEDEGDAISMCLFIYNVQNNVHINYATGASRMVGEDDGEPAVKCDYVLNTNSKKIHKPDCTHVSTMADRNKQEYNGYIDDLLNEGYSKCNTCKPE